VAPLRSDRRNPPAKPPVDVDALPEQYCLGLEGDCLEPLLPDGASVLIQKSAPYAVGDIVCIWWRSEFMKPGMYQGWLKRLAMAAPPWVKKYPHNEHPEFEVQVCIFLKQLNPPRTYAMPCKHILAIHKAVGYCAGATIGGTVRSDRIKPIDTSGAERDGEGLMSGHQLITSHRKRPSCTSADQRPRAFASKRQNY
jgi:hypothetical protein